MATFAQRKAARESVEAGSEKIDGLSNIESPEDNLDQQLTELSPLDAELDAADRDQELLTTDTERTDNAIAQADEAIENGEELPEEAVAAAEVAQESIRRRWQLNTTKLARESYRRGRGMTKAAREGWVDTAKDLYARFIEFCKMVIDKIKDLKLKYLNVGKTAQNRAKKYQEIIRKLGKKKKDEISGSWINKLSIETKFNVDTSISIAKDVVTGKVKSAVAKLTEQAAQASTMLTKVADSDDFTAQSGDATIDLPGTVASKLSALPQFEEDVNAGRLMALPGNAFIQSATKKVGEVDMVAVGFITTGDAAEEKSVDTPNTSALSSAAGSMALIGKGYEKMLQDFRSYDSGIKTLETAAEKAKRAFDNVKEDGKREAASQARTAADQAVRNYQTIYRAVNHVANSVISGLNGYISAGIGAYEKK